MSKDEALELSEDQIQVRDGIVAWCLAIPGGAPMSQTMSGLAGTGKTTLISALIEHDTFENWSVLAPTGKAVSVLRRKGLPASTIHSFAYNYKGMDEHGNPEFDAKEGLHRYPSGLIIDEASMINHVVHDDVVELGLPVLFVGDHGQLPPVGTDPEIMKNPDFVLEKIHRQAAGNPIIDCAYRVRNGELPAEDWTSDRVWVVRGTVGRVVDNARAADSDVILVATNHARHRINAEWRSRILGFTGDLKDRDRVVCLKNNRRKGVINGEIFRVLVCTPIDLGFKCLLKDDWSGRLLDIRVHKGGFGKQPDREAHVEADANNMHLFDFAYALTCHKAQGSEWSNVFVFDDAKYDVLRWRYTACTRASERLTIQRG